MMFQSKIDFVLSGHHGNLCFREGVASATLVLEVCEKVHEQVASNFGLKQKHDKKNSQHL